MPLPRGDEYYTAIQNPSIVFQDADLKACKVETDQNGLPKPYAGGFTTTYHLFNNTQHWAVRCFTREIRDLQMRYIAISRFLEKNKHDIFVNATSLQQGIRINGIWHPIIKMQWLDGKPLNIFISQNLRNPSKISKLPDEFLNMVHTLEKLGVAHGDLQHGNIMIKNGKFYLIDYDGFFVPELSGNKANEIGHVNYQHLQRNENYFDAKIDHFSSIVIYLGLKAIAISPQLWTKYDNSENILFRRDDFIDFDNSQILSDISSFSELAPLVDRFKGICRLEFNKVPNLDQFISGNFIYPKITTSIRPNINIRNQYPVIDGSQINELLKHVGDRIEVIGFISHYHFGYTRYRRPYAFLNIGVYPKHTFTVVLWSSTLGIFQQSGIDPKDYNLQWVRIVGVIGKYNDKPQMSIDTFSQINKLQGENEAIQILKGVNKPPVKSKPVPTKSHSPKTMPSPPKIYDNGRDKEEKVLTKIYQDKVPITPTEPPLHIPSIPAVNSPTIQTQGKINFIILKMKQILKYFLSLWQ